jgi:hypothetical protein
VVAPPVTGLREPALVAALSTVLDREAAMMRTHFDEHGFVRLGGAFAEQAPAMADALWAELLRVHGIDRERRATWTVVERRGLGALRRTGAFDALATPAVRAAMRELAGDVPEPFSWGDPLVTSRRRARAACRKRGGTSTSRPARPCGSRGSGPSSPSARAAGARSCSPARTGPSRTSWPGATRPTPAAQPTSAPPW